MINKARLDEMLTYQPETGEFIWNAARGRQPKGSIAGCDSHRGYLKCRVDGKEYYLHRLAWLHHHGSFPSMDIDHINGDRTDNRIENLRAVSRQQNHQNRGITSLNRSGFVGVFWNTARGKWTARIKVSGKNIHIGDFDDIGQAAHARLIAEKEKGFHSNHGNRPAFEAVKSA